MQRTEKFRIYQSIHKSHWDGIAQQLDHWNGWGGYYRNRLRRIYQFHIPPAMNVLEIGCARGDLLASLKPIRGVGIDLSSEMIKRANQRHPNLVFMQGDIHKIELDEKFDYIILSDLINDLWDVEAVFHKIYKWSKPSTRIILNYYNRLWEWPLALAQKLRLAQRTLPQNWLSVDDVNNLLYLGGFEVIREWEEVLSPLPIPLLSAFCNRFLVRLWLFRSLAMTAFTLARPIPSISEHASETGVSVVVPARNEEGNIKQIFERVPQMGSGTELIFVEGHSQDNTYEAIQQEMRNHPEVNAKLFRQEGKGKGDAVRLGFANASGGILMILDADLTVPPEDLPRFYQAIQSGRGDFINGVRLVYPMEKQAMRFLNYIGNKIFSLLFSFLLDQPIKDTLCGTKVLWQKDYERIASNRPYFGDFDPFGDFDLLFGAAKLNLKIVDLPIRYEERTYGTTNIQRWKHGWLLLKMVLFAARRIKFI
ncbi:MAG: glycosyltransferase [Anaerolineaceae bacterium]|jgi:ubiquinone/menaquinone biosynthesis C-methylase UbiE|nr:MAG: glycosyltransferase [Anaerolineaceae bacterium]